MAGFLFPAFCISITKFGFFPGCVPSSSLFCPRKLASPFLPEHSDEFPRNDIKNVVFWPKRSSQKNIRQRFKDHHILRLFFVFRSIPQPSKVCLCVCAAVPQPLTSENTYLELGWVENKPVILVKRCVYFEPGKIGNSGQGSFAFAQLGFGH